MQQFQNVNNNYTEFSINWLYVHNKKCFKQITKDVLKCENIIAMLLEYMKDHPLRQNETD